MSGKKRSLKKKTEIFEEDTDKEIKIFEENTNKEAEIFEENVNNEDEGEYINLKEATEKLRQVAEGSKIIEVPEGEPLFLFSSAVGKTRPINVFYDKGCSHVVFSDGVPPQEPTLGSFEKLLRISSKSPGEILRRNEVDSKRFGRESSVGEI